MPNQSDIDNRANQLNPNNDAYYQSRGWEDKEEDDPFNAMWLRKQAAVMQKPVRPADDDDDDY